MKLTDTIAAMRKRAQKTGGALWTTKEAATEIGCSLPTARIALAKLVEEGWLREGYRGRWHVQTAEDRMQKLQSRGISTQAKLLVSDLESEGVDAAVSTEDPGRVVVSVAYLRELREKAAATC